MMFIITKTGIGIWRRNCQQTQELCTTPGWQDQAPGPGNHCAHGLVLQPLGEVCNYCERYYIKSSAKMCGRCMHKTRMYWHGNDPSIYSAEEKHGQWRTEMSRTSWIWRFIFRYISFYVKLTSSNPANSGSSVYRGSCRYFWDVRLRLFQLVE